MHKSVDLMLHGKRKHGNKEIKNVVVFRNQTPAQVPFHRDFEVGPE